MPIINASLIADVCGSIDLNERLRLFDFTERDHAIAQLVWTLLAPHAEAVATEQVDSWFALFPPTGNEDRAALVARGADQMRERFSNLDHPGWIRRGAIRLSLAFEAQDSLTRMLAMGNATALIIVNLINDHYDCSKAERAAINEFFFRLRSLECDIYSTIYTAYVADEARALRHGLATSFRSGIADLVASAGEEGRELRDQTVDSSVAARGVRDKASHVAAAAEQSAGTMRDAASLAEGLIRAIEQTRSEVEQAAAVAERAGTQAAEAVGVSQQLRDQVHSINSILALIRQIAKQTNLLALNATIEAAHAGAAGRGFAVVAQEVKALAHQTASATDDVARMIAAIEQATQSTLVNNASIKATVDDVQTSAGRIRSAMGAQARTVADITASIDETAQAADSMYVTIAAINGDIAVVTKAVDDVGHGFDRLDERLSVLRASADAFAARVAV